MTDRKHLQGWDVQSQAGLAAAGEPRSAASNTMWVLQQRPALLTEEAEGDPPLVWVRWACDAIKSDKQLMPICFSLSCALSKGENFSHLSLISYFLTLLSSPFSTSSSLST